MKSKKAIKKLKKQLNAEVIELANAIKEDRGQINEKATYSYVDTFKTITAERLTNLEEIVDRLQSHVYTQKCECNTNTQKPNPNAAASIAERQSAFVPTKIEIFRFGTDDLHGQPPASHTNTQKTNSNATVSPKMAKIVTNAMFNEETSQILLDIRNAGLQPIAYEALDTILSTGLQYTQLLKVWEKYNG